MRSSDGSFDSAAAGSPQYSAPRVAPVAAAVFLILLAATLLTVSIVGFLNPLERAAGEDTGGLVVRLVAAIVLGIGSLLLLVFAISSLPAAIVRRFDVDASGISLTSLSGVVFLGWDEIRSIRLLAKTRNSLSYQPPGFPRSLRRRSTSWLQFTLVDETELEQGQPALRKLRLKSRPFAPTDGYTHGVPILTGVFAPSYDIADYAPDLQRTLEAHAGNAYVGAELIDYSA